MENPSMRVERSSEHLSPDNQQGVREALGLTPESYVFDFIRHGETNGLRLEPWEQAYQDAGLIEKAERLGYIYIDSNVACDITVTAHGRTAAKLHAALAQSPANRDGDLGIVLSALRMLEEDTGEKFDDDGGDVAAIERDWNARNLKSPESAGPKSEGGPQHPERLNVSQPKPRSPLPEADIPARREGCSEQRLGHDHD